jgi:sterol 24-C-methyltransferase
MAQATAMSKLQFWSYRIGTVLKSLKTLYTLPKEKVDAFLNSYNIYDHDWTNEEELIRDMGPDYYKEVQKKLVDYYCVLNHLCAVGQVEKMYIPPAMDLSKSIIANQALFEKMMASDLGLAKGKRALDIGCGRGRVANHMASHTGADVVGMNLDPDQLESARRFAQGNGLSDQCLFLKGDLNETPYPFPDNHFDAVYEIQVVFSLAKDPLKAFKEIHRILKPGGRFGSLEWVRLDKYDPNNSQHTSLMRRIKPLIGAIGTLSVEEAEKYLKEAGFEIVKNENASIGGLQAPLIENADKFFTRVTALIEFLVRFKILPKHFKALFDRLTKDGEAFIEADRMGLVTTSHYMVAEKK